MIDCCFGAVAAIYRSFIVETPFMCGHKLLAVTERMISQTSGQDDISLQGG